MLDYYNWRRFSGTFSFSENDPIESVTVEIVADDSVITNENNENVPLYITDVHFQAGNQLTGWIPETRELTKKILHGNNEEKNIVSKDDVFEGGKRPVVWKDVEFSEYNIAGRGLEAFTIPNWYPEDWTMDILPTGLDIVITPKDDYDFCRVSTNSGSLVSEEDFYNKDPDHPLSIAYTREFCLGAGKAGDKIEILSRTGKARRGGRALKVGGVATVTLGDGKTLPIKRRSFFLAQKGAVRIRFEFYKLKNGILTDTGIGYQGTVKFNQWTYGRGRA